MNKKIAIYLDGTWNTPENRTNVFTLFEETVGDIAGPDILEQHYYGWKRPFAAIKDIFAYNARVIWLRKQYISLKKSPQVKYYDQGVGTKLMNLIRGGVFGNGVNLNVRQAYEFLCYCYEPGDSIYVFGFSRGAYTARSLVGVIDSIGLLEDIEISEDNKLREAMDYVNELNMVAKPRKRSKRSQTTE